MFKILTIISSRKFYGNTSIPDWVCTRNLEVAKATTFEDPEQRRRRQHELAIPIPLSVLTDGIAVAEVKV